MKNTYCLLVRFTVGITFEEALFSSNYFVVIKTNFDDTFIAMG